MIYRPLFDRARPGRTVRAGVIGAGNYATAVVTQSASIPRLDVPAVADVDVDAARQAFLQAGYAEADLAVCENRKAALKAIEQGRRAVTADAMLLMDVPLDVIVEATGAPEAGARHAQAAIAHGKHVAMVNKETDVTVGPALKALADRAGVVYTAVDGDQHGLLMGLVDWARELGLEVLCGGKFRNAEVVLNAAAATATLEDRAKKLDADGMRALGPMPPGQVADIVQARRALFADRPHIRTSDVGEMAIAANATGLLPDVDALHCPVLRASEVAEAMCPREDGGMLRQRGAIDAVTCLRRPSEAGLGGGVFTVVACENAYSRRIMTGKGLAPNSRGTASLVYRPYHLCGVETAMSILCAGLLGVPTGAAELLPRVDLVAQATADLKAGETLAGDHSPKLKALMRPAQPVASGAPLPFYMASGNALAVDVPAGEVITADQVVRPAGSVLWGLRTEQDKQFLGGKMAQWITENAGIDRGSRDRPE